MKARNTSDTTETGMRLLDVDSLVVPPESAIVPELSAEQAEALLTSIRAKGIEQPLRVYRVGPAYAVLSGRHRFGCARLLNLKTVPCVIVEKPADVGLAMVEEAVLNRVVTLAGRAAMIVDAIPALLDRNGKNGNPSGRNGHSMAIPQEKGSDEPKIREISKQYGVHRDYLAAVIAARLACKDADEWKKLKAKLFDGPIGPSYIMQTLCGIQSGGKNDETGLVGRAGADVNTLAKRIPATLTTVFKRWGAIGEASRAVFMTRFRDSLRVLPTDGHVAIRDAVKDWPEHELREMKVAVDSRVKALEKERKA